MKNLKCFGGNSFPSLKKNQSSNTQKNKSDILRRWANTHHWTLLPEKIINRHSWLCIPKIQNSSLRIWFWNSKLVRRLVTCQKIKKQKEMKSKTRKTSMRKTIMKLNYKGMKWVSNSKKQKRKKRRKINWLHWKKHMRLPDSQSFMG